MRTLLSTVVSIFVLSAFSSVTYANQAEMDKCNKFASVIVMQSFAEYFVGTNGDQLRVLESSECLRVNGVDEVTCEVLTGDGTGSLDVFYDVDMNKNCDKSLGAKIYYIE